MQQPLLNSRFYLLSALALFILGCQSRPPRVTMPPEPEPTDIAVQPEVVEAPKPVTTPETPPPDYKLMAGEQPTTFADLEAGSVAKDQIITVITDPNKVEYERTEMLMTKVSQLGYQVDYRDE